VGAVTRDLVSLTGKLVDKSSKTKAETGMMGNQRNIGITAFGTDDTRMARDAHIGAPHVNEQLESVTDTGGRVEGQGPLLG